MAEGRKQVHREFLIAQAGLLFFEGSSDDLETFIRTGTLEVTKRNVMPCSTTVLAAMQRATDQQRAKAGKAKRNGKRK
jgi:hypothetical protein